MERGDKIMKEFIQKTIMMQESVFKQQVKELHRLYYLQKRLTAEKEMQGKEKGEPYIFRGSGEPARGSFNSPISETGSGCIQSVLGIKRPRSTELKGCSFEDGSELELSLGIRGKVNKHRPDRVSRQVEGREIRSCLGRVGLRLSALHSSSRSSPKIQNQEENFHHLQLQLSI